MLTKDKESKLIGQVWSMAVQSLDPESFDALNKAMKVMAKNRNIPEAYLNIDCPALLDEETPQDA
jgi:hypothetical protein